MYNRLNLVLLQRKILEFQFFDKGRCAPPSVLKVPLAKFEHYSLQVHVWRCPFGSSNGHSGLCQFAFMDRPEIGPFRSNYANQRTAPPARLTSVHATLKTAKQHGLGVTGPPPPSLHQRCRTLLENFRSRRPCLQLRCAGVTTDATRQTVFNRQ